MPGYSLLIDDKSAIAPRDIPYHIAPQYKYYYEDFNCAIRDRIDPMLKGLRHSTVSEENIVKRKEFVARCVKRIVEIYQIAAVESGVSLQLRSFHSGESSLN